MRTRNKISKKVLKNVGSDFIENLWEQSWTYIKTVVDVVREPILILDKELRVVAANESFYKTFQVEPRDTQNKIIYKLGNGQWDIPALRTLLENILPKNTFFKGFEVTHDFLSIGHKVMILNARQIHFKGDNSFQPIILLAIEDITEMMDVAEKLATHTKNFEEKILQRTIKLEDHISKLKEEIEILKTKKS